MLEELHKKIAAKRAAKVAAAGAEPPAQPATASSDDSGMQLPSGTVDLEGNGDAEPSGDDLEAQQRRLAAEQEVAIAAFEQAEAAHLASVEAFEAANKSRMKAKANLLDRSKRRTAANERGRIEAADGPGRGRSRSASERRRTSAATTIAVKVEIVEIEDEPA